MTPRTDEIVWRDYQRHESRPGEKLLELLTRLEKEAGIGRGTARAFITGGAGAAYAELVGAHYVQEVAAVAMAAERRHPEARTIIELGGQDAKIIIFEEEVAGRSRKTVSMNDKCAGGTGVVIDKIAQQAEDPPRHARPDAVRRPEGLPDRRQVRRLRRDRHQRPAEARRAGRGADGLALRRHRPAEPDRAVARATRCRPGVLLLGGPHAFIRGAARGLAGAHPASGGASAGTPLPEGATPEELIVTPPMAEYFGALGGVEFARRERDGATEYLGPGRLAEALGAGLRGQPARGGGRRRDRGWTSPSSAGSTSGRRGRRPTLERGAHVRGFIGLDAGSTSTKAVLLDEDGQVLAKAYQLSRGNPIEDAIEMFAALRTQIESQGASVEVGGLVTTGYAKDILKDVFAGRRRARRDGGARQLRARTSTTTRTSSWTSAARTSRSS